MQVAIVLRNRKTLKRQLRKSLEEGHTRKDDVKNILVSISWALL